MTRRAVIAGNWKMNKTPEEAVKVINELKPLVIIAIIWICVLFSYLIMAYIKRKNHFK